MHQKHARQREKITIKNQLYNIYTGFNAHKMRGFGAVKGTITTAYNDVRYYLTKRRIGKMKNKAKKQKGTDFKEVEMSLRRFYREFITAYGACF
jgi:hypothetical protein